MKRFDERPLSWSALSSWNYDKEQWYKKYVLCREQPASKEMIFGKSIGEQYASDPTFLPYLPRNLVFEYPLFGKLGGLALIGYIDSYTPHTDLIEIKTGKKEWTQKRVDEHQQFDMYLLLLKIQHKVNPEDVRCRLVWLPTVLTGDFAISLIDTPPVIFETKRTTKDILLFGAQVMDIYKQMQRYAETRARGNALVSACNAHRSMQRIIKRT